MNKTKLKKIISGGEDSRMQFKADLRNADSLAAEMVAFSNSEGGRILIGVSDNGSLNLACVLLFTERPEWIKPQFIVKAVCYPGNEIHVTEYLDTEDFSGPLEKVFDDSMAFVLHNLHKVQAGRGVNAPGFRRSRLWCLKNCWLMRWYIAIIWSAHPFAFLFTTTGLRSSVPAIYPTA